MKKTVVPAIIAESQEKLEERFNRVKSSASLIQLDVMDGKFVPVKSLNFDFKLPKSKAKLEAHLMIKNPERWINENYSKVDTILLHYESTKDIGKLIHEVKRKKKRVGLAINPKTSVKKLRPYLAELDQVLVLTVNPGYYGRKFLLENLKKVKLLRSMKPKLDIEVDGGINPSTIKKAAKVGANIFVSGSYIINSKDSKGALKLLRKSIKK